MKDFWLYTILLTLLSSLIFVPMGFDGSGIASIQSGLDNPGVGNGHLGNGNSNSGLKKGHTDYKGQGLGHVKHDCYILCPICNGNPHVPPCTGS